MASNLPIRYRLISIAILQKVQKMLIPAIYLALGTAGNILLLSYQVIKNLAVGQYAFVARRSELPGTKLFPRNNACACSSE
jgi:hypothetical protein